jgi:hypothetical protein
MRKTWGHLQHKLYDEKVSRLMRAYGHASEQQTLEYLCIRPIEIAGLYAREF